MTSHEYRPYWTPLSPFSIINLPGQFLLSYLFEAGFHSGDNVLLMAKILAKFKVNSGVLLAMKMNKEGIKG